MSLLNDIRKIEDHTLFNLLILTFHVITGSALIVYYNYNLFLDLDAVKLIILSLTITVPFAFFLFIILYRFLRLRYHPKNLMHGAFSISTTFIFILFMGIIVLDYLLSIGFGPLEGLNFRIPFDLSLLIVAIIIFVALPLILFLFDKKFRESLIYELFHPFSSLKKRLHTK